MRVPVALAFALEGLSTVATARAPAQKPPLDGETLAGAFATITDSFEAHGVVDRRAYGSGDAVTQPSFGRTVVSFAPAPTAVQPR